MRAEVVNMRAEGSKSSGEYLFIYLYNTYITPYSQINVLYCAKLRQQCNRIYLYIIDCW